MAPTRFANAVHLLQRADHEAIGELNSDLAGALLEPLRAAGQLRLVDGAEALAPGVRVEHAPGHTPGHQVVLVEHAGETVAVSGDGFVHAVQVVDPEVAYRFEPIPRRPGRPGAAC